MSNKIETSGKTALMTITDSSLSGPVANELKVETIKLIDSGIIHISLDLGDTKYIDSSGIGKLLFLNKKIMACRGNFEITKISCSLYEFLDSLTITKIIKINNPN
ncbi:MAG: hypothetical protein B6229_00720 [Spirochaetaceae bacterium 4572_7]|nr:MAG: hypothetical protein B6229_00720 [Spirochaetaceae bacterium 4572_7]